MNNSNVELLLKAAHDNPGLYSALLTQPRETAAALGVSLTSAELKALRTASDVISRSAEEHDHNQGRMGKRCLFLPVMGSLPRKGPRKVPKRRKKPKPS